MMKKKLIVLIIGPAILLGGEGMAVQAGSLSDATAESLWGIKLGGYLDMSYIYNLNDPEENQGGNIMRVFDVDHNEINFQLFQFYIDRLPEESNEVGFRVDFALGEDSNLIVFDPLVDFGDDFNIYQAYISYIAPIGNGLTIDLGRWVTHHGYEVIESPANSHFSRSILFGWAIPFTHTGLRLTYPFNDMWEVSGAVTQGWDWVDDNNDSKTFHGAVRFRPTESIYIQNSVAWGPELDDNNHDYRLLYDLVATWQVNEQWSVGANFDWAQDENQAPGGGDAEWMGIAGYARYDLLENLYVALRGEWFDDADGARASAFNLSGPGGVVVPDVDVWEITATLGYSPVKNLMTRLEYRHDDASREVFLDGHGLSDTQDTIAFEVIYSF